MRDLAFIAAWVVLLPTAFRGAHLGTMLWAWTSLLAPNDVLYGAGAQIPFAKLAALPTAFLLVLGRRQGLRIRIGRTAFLLIALAAISVASQATSTMSDPGAGWDLCEKYLKVLALGVAVLWTMTDRIRIHGLLMVVCLGVGFTAVAEGAKFILSGSAHKVLGSPSIGDNNQVALDILMILPMLQYLYGTAQRRAFRLACLAAGALGVVAIVATFSRGGAAGLAIVGAASVLASRRRGLAIAALAIAAALGAALVGPDWVARMDTVQDVQGDSSFMGRVVAWKVSTALAIAHPLFGGGFHAIQHADVWNDQQAGVLALDAVPTPPQGTEPRAAHSIYFEVLGDLGFSGLACLLLLLLGAWRDTGATIRAIARSGREDLAWARDLAARLRVSLLALLVSGGLLSAAYYDIIYLLICLIAATRAAADPGAPPLDPAKGGALGTRSFSPLVRGAARSSPSGIASREPPRSRPRSPSR